MARWAAGAAERLQRSALELFAGQGFERTTAAEIAEHAGLTERTFFRHFTDKREVLFHGQDHFEGAFLAGLADAPAGSAPIAVVAAAVRAGGSLFAERGRAHARARQQVIDANPALQERERHKLAGLGVALGRALSDRGVPEPAATLAARSGMTVFGIAFTQWIDPDETRPLPDIVDALFGELAAVTRPAGTA